MQGTLRLLGFERVTLEAGSSRELRVVVDPRLLASFDPSADRWRIEGGTYEITLAPSAGAPGNSATVALRARLFGR
jgi:beta-glucosidase